MIVDEPSSYAYYGSIVAAPAVSDVFSKIFSYEKINPTISEQTEYVTMPDLIGVSYSEAIKTLKALSLTFETDGDGDVIRTTLPLAGEQIPKGDVVLLRI
jgi:beta-lactam-binding protein with PASTA domain